jgi:SAP domain-containing new25
MLAGLPSWAWFRQKQIECQSLLSPTKMPGPADVSTGIQASTQSEILESITGCSKNHAMGRVRNLELHEAIYYLRMDELRLACRQLRLQARGQKRELVQRILSALGGQAVTSVASLKRQARSHERQTYKNSARMMPGSYTNGAAARAFFKNAIGPHFHFTVYGMDWIQARWAVGEHPTFSQFVTYWNREYAARKAGKDFATKPELARVRFLRAQKRRGPVSKSILEALWLEEREVMSQFVRGKIEAFLEETQAVTAQTAIPVSTWPPPESR